MRYISSRDESVYYSDNEAVLKNFTPEGGVFVPEEFPVFTDRDWERLTKGSLEKKLTFVISKFLPSLPIDKLEDAFKKVLMRSKVQLDVKLTALNEYSPYPYSFELWHGPGASFYDIIANISPVIYSFAHERSAERIGKKLLFLVSSLPETTKSWVEGLSATEAEFIVFAASENNKQRNNRGRRRKKKQRLSSLDLDNFENIDLIGSEKLRASLLDINLELDDLENNIELNNFLDEKSYVIQVIKDYSWPVLLAEIAYFCILSAELRALENYESDELVDIVIPSSNLSNILAALYAKSLGANFGEIILAANKNNLLVDLLRNGKYNVRRRSYNTNSPDLDLLGSENLQRLLFEFAERDSNKLCKWMDELAESGQFNVDSRTLKNMQTLMLAGFSDDANTRQAIVAVYTEYDHMVDPHTATGFAVYERYRKNVNPEPRRVVFLSLFSPYVFPVAVAEALLDNLEKYNYIDQLRLDLFKETDLIIPVRYELANIYAELANIEAESKKNENKFYGEKVFINTAHEEQKPEEDEAEKEFLLRRQQNAESNLEKLKSEYSTINFKNEEVRTAKDIISIVENKVGKSTDED